ncbi:MAG: phytanoyl-CoA dioxygenase family protein, partial [SAR324 cluster bacterium]|nr:phytanoyl-CoA dioxygenase family protein [SAR324 cluster bacterium]
RRGRERCMGKFLSAEQIGQFQRDGYVPALTAFPVQEAARYRRCLEDFEKAQGGPLTSLGMFYMYKLHLLFNWAWQVVAHPAVLNAVEDLIGGDILVYTSKFFIKEPHTPAITAWHQDATHFGFATPASVAAWIAFADAPLESGCVEFLPGSHGLGQLQHRSKAHPDSISGGGQSIISPIDVATSVAAPLRAGQFSLHHSLCAHRSQPNMTDHRRIGLSVHYVSPAVPHLGSKRLPAALVRGRDGHGHYDLMPRPRQDFDAAAQAAHKEAFHRYRANYEEQEARHAAGEAVPSAS